MVNQYTLSNPPSLELINDVATQIWCAPAFVEKDWYAVQLIKVLSECSFDNGYLIFGGGTSLFKAYNLIKEIL